MDTETLIKNMQSKITGTSGVQRDYRETHLALFKKEGFKTEDQDFYKFTNIAAFLKETKTSDSRSASHLLKKSESQYTTLVILDGVPQLKDFNLPGVSTVLLGAAYPQSKNKKNALTHLHHGLLASGLILEVEKNTKVNIPIRLIYQNSSPEIVASTVIIKLQANSELTLIEELSTDSTLTLTTETHLELEAGAKLEHLQLSEGYSDNFLHGSTYASVKKDATYRNFVFHLSGRLNRRNLELSLLEAGAHGESYNLYLTSETEHSDINTVIEHQAPDTTSSQLAKGILDGESKGIFTGKIHIFPKAQRVASGQLNKNLLLSKKAQAHSQPQLEIFADDVKCSHGSTTGQLSADEIFYFKARGIPEDRARTLLAHGFGLEVVLKIGNEVARENFGSLILEKLKTKFNIGGN